MLTSNQDSLSNHPNDQQKALPTLDALDPNLGQGLIYRACGLPGGKDLLVKYDGCGPNQGVQPGRCPARGSAIAMTLITAARTTAASAPTRMV